MWKLEPGKGFRSCAGRRDETKVCKDHAEVGKHCGSWQNCKKCVLWKGASSLFEGVLHTYFIVL